MDFGEMVLLASQKSRLSEEEVRHNIEVKKKEFSGLIDDDSAARLVLKDLGVSVPSELPEPVFSPIAEITGNKIAEPNAVVRVMQVNSPKAFESDGRQGRVCNIEVADASGKATLVFWEEDVRWMERRALERNDALELIGLSVKNFNPLELHSGMLTEIILHKQGRGLPGATLAGLPESAVPLASVPTLHEGDVADMYLRATAVSELREFERAGRKGRVLNVLSEDSEGRRLNVVLWDYYAEAAAKMLKLGEAFKLEGFAVRKGQQGLELQNTWQSHAVFEPTGSPLGRKSPAEPAMQIADLKSKGRGIVSAQVKRVISASAENNVVSADAELSDSSGSVVVSFLGKPALALLQLRHAPKFDIRTAVSLKEEHLKGSKMRLIIQKRSRANVVKYVAEEVLEGGLP
jgi:replication factor A1